MDAVVVTAGAVDTARRRREPGAAAVGAAVRASDQGCLGSVSRFTGEGPAARNEGFERRITNEIHARSP